MHQCTSVECLTVSHPRCQWHFQRASRLSSSDWRARPCPPGMLAQTCLCRLRWRTAAACQATEVGTRELRSLRDCWSTIHHPGEPSLPAGTPHSSQGPQRRHGLPPRLDAAYYRHSATAGPTAGCSYETGSSEPSERWPASTPRKTKCTSTVTISSDVNTTKSLGMPLQALPKLTSAPYISTCIRSTSRR